MVGFGLQIFVGFLVGCPVGHPLKLAVGFRKSQMQRSTTPDLNANGRTGAMVVIGNKRQPLEMVERDNRER